MSQKNNNKKIALECAVAPWRISSKLAFIVGTGLIISSCASAQASDEVANAALSNRLLQKINEQDRKIAERDRVIDDLMHRVQQLEHQGVATSQVKQSPAADSVAAAQTAPPINLPVQKKTTAAQGKAAPGSFEVDEDAAQRALERTLVQTGALLLPFGQAEVQPFATYSRREAKQILSFVKDDTGYLSGVTNADIRQNEFDMGANLLVGLPFESQAEFRIPYQIINHSTVIRAGTNSQEISNTGNSLGNIRVGLAKTLMHESNWLPDLIARLAVDTPTGSVTNNNVAMNGGYTDFIASMTALKRQDPLAFTGTFAYQKTLKKNNIEPGDQFNLTLGTTLAASPQTSLSIGLQQTYALKTRINNINVQGSDTLSSFFTVGAASTIGRHLFFSTLGGIGLTDSSPAYFLNITVPFRFDSPYKPSANKS